MKKNTKILCSVLTMLLISSTAPNVFAASNSGATVSDPNTIYVKKDKKGDYLVADKISSTMTAKETKNHGVYQTETGDLITSTGTGAYLKVEEHDASLTDKKAIKELLNNDNITNEVKNDILKHSNDAIAQHNSKANISVVIPKVNSQSTTGITPNGVTDNYYTYNGHNMMNEHIYYYTMATGPKYVKKGSTAYRIADTMLNVGVVGLGFTAAPWTYVAGAISLLSYFENATGQYNISGDSSDYTYINFTYDVDTIWTYADMGSGYQLGAITQYVKMDTIDTQQQYMVNSRGTQVNSHRDVYSSFASPHYGSPEALALQWINNPWDERMHTSVGDLTLWY